VFGGGEEAGVIRSSDWVESAFGRFAWEDDPKQRGAITILGEWARQAIVAVAPPFELRDGRGRPLSTIWCHRLVAPALGRVLADLMRRNLCHLVNTFDGCFVPRHTQWNPEKALSRHAWGIAVDVNARLFPYGSKATQNRRLVEAFKRQGFAWGGEWRTPDPMHFEIVDLAQPARPLSIVVDGKRVVDGFMYEGRAVAPIREVAEAIGARVTARIAEGEVEVMTPGYEPE
jgi:hypothetical protein